MSLGAPFSKLVITEESVLASVDGAYQRARMLRLQLLHSYGLRYGHSFGSNPPCSREGILESRAHAEVRLVPVVKRVRARPGAVLRGLERLEDGGDGDAVLGSAQGLPGTAVACCHLDACRNVPHAC